MGLKIIFVATIFLCSAKVIAQDSQETCGFNAVATTTSQPITSPNYPNNYTNNLDCTWTITAPPGMRLRLEFHSFSTEREYDTLSIYKGNRRLRQYSGSVERLVYRTTENNITLRFVTDGSVTRPGFNGSFFTWMVTTTTAVTRTRTCDFNYVATTTSQPITSRNYPNNYPNNENCFWMITASDGMRVQLNLITFETELNADFLTVSNGDTNLAKLSGSYSNKILRSDNNSLILRFTSDNSLTKSGFNATFVEYDPTTIETAVGSHSTCGNNLVATTTSQPITSPNYPNNYPNNADCTWTITASGEKKIQLTVEILLSEKYFDFLTILSGDTQLAKLSGIQTNRVFTSFGNILTVKFTSDQSITQYGFRATYIEHTPQAKENDCHFNQVAMTTSQPITSPNYPNNYPNNANCSWRITAPEGMRVQINFASFDTESDYDILTLFNGNRLMRRLSGNIINRVYTSRGNVLFLTFISDSSYVRPGFTGTYQIFVRTTTTTVTTTTSTISTTRLPETCGYNAVATSTRRLITSPNYPNNYPNNVDCTWTITASEGMSVQLNLITFLSERNYDFLTISSNGKQLARLSGYHPNRKYKSEGDILILRFTSDPSRATGNFRATFSAIPSQKCGFNAVATTTSQPIISPNYPNKYPNEADCTWTITASVGMRVQINLHNLNTEKVFDYFIILEGERQIVRLSGVESNRVITSSGNSITVKFTSDRRVNGTGFNASFIGILLYKDAK
uniref:CUB and sushi domain-containing protein 3-like n=1 Tax=Ciona intestinalis TaxID=7719 RepID=UPI000EF473CF|nr:CUB and sushi domain-containing protein 3-like [Ciona intestinalis]|eukprot:XP_026694942.1 CUB and sushi domain-containing protein 3-like [Ciona intestinalis]